MPREDLLTLVADNGDHLEPGRLQFPDRKLRPRLQFAGRLGDSGIRYEPVGFQDFHAHAGLTGAIIERILEAIAGNSPPVYRELCGYIHTIRGYELPTSLLGTVGSFSDPTLPSVMSVNIPYTSDDQPCISPFCFTWFGHELGHTKDYLIDNILYHRRLRFVLNSADNVGVIPRYGRAFTVRTLFQIPYVHLYELALLTDFVDHDFAGLPWSVCEDATELGEDIVAEIAEAFERIDGQVRLTALGACAVCHFRKLFTGAVERWHSSVSAHCH
jgi:hypothetical protein